MATKELIEFITDYSESDIEYLQSDISKDYEFLFSIWGIVKNDFSICSDRLVIDLYISLSNVAKETYSIYTDYPLFANELLNRGHIKYFQFYLEGAHKSFDTLSLYLCHSLLKTEIWLQSLNLKSKITQSFIQIRVTMKI